VNRRLNVLALASTLLLPSCSFFELKDTGTAARPASPRGAFRPTVADGSGFRTQAPTRSAPTEKPVAPPAPVMAAAPQTPAPTPVQPAPAVAAKPAARPTASQPVELPTPAVKPAPAPVVKSTPPPAPAQPKRRPAQDAEQLRLPGDMLNELPGDKDYQSTKPAANDGAPVIAKPPGSSR
jgi:hypothetical protein